MDALRRERSTNTFGTPIMGPGCETCIDYQGLGGDGWTPALCLRGMVSIGRCDDYAPSQAKERPCPPSTSTP